MKRTLAALTVLAAAFLVTPLAAQPAQAAQAAQAARAGGGLYVQIGDHGHDKRHWNKKHWNKKHHHKKRWHKRHGHHHDRHWGGFVLNFGTPYYQPARPCHATERDGYFRGRYARIGETVCYNGHGRPYVVDGSSFVIHFY